MPEPKYSIIIPTRDRPAYVDLAIDSACLQTVSDLEVVVFDNPSKSDCEDVAERYAAADSRVRYCRAPEELPMHDNWEAALKEAKGEWVLMIEDKFALFPKALEFLERVVAADDELELVSWGEALFLIPEDVAGAEDGILEGSPPAELEGYPLNGEEIIAQKLLLDIRRVRYGKNYFSGKIIFGAYRRSLIERMLQRGGRIFPPCAPDYTSMVGALLESRKSYQIDGHLVVHRISTWLSNGNQFRMSEEGALRFLRGCDPSLALIESLPIPGVFISQYNLLAEDIAGMCKKYGEHELAGLLNRRRLVQFVYEELLELRRDNPASAEKQFTRFRSYFNAQPAAERLILRYHLFLGWCYYLVWRSNFLFKAKRAIRERKGALARVIYATLVKMGRLRPSEVVNLREVMRDFAG